MAGQAPADQILLKDGDRITGAILKKDGPNVTIRSKNFGVVTLKWDDIATVTTGQPLHVVLSDGSTVKAKIQTQQDRIRLEGPGAPPSVEPAGIAALRDDAEQRIFERMHHPGVFDLWTITGSLNLAGTGGNAKTATLTTPIGFVRASNTSRTTAHFNSIRSTATIAGVNGQTANAIRGGWGFGRNLNKRIVANAFNDYEYDKFQSLDLRVVFGGGLGYQVWRRETGRLALSAGGAWNREKFDPLNKPAFTRNAAEIYWGNDFHYKLNSRTNLVESSRVFNNLSTTGQYRVNFDLSTQTQLAKWLNWNISFSDRYLSNPISGRKRNDLLYSTGLGFTFAR